MNPSILTTLLLLALLGGAISFPEDGSHDVLPKDQLSQDQRKHNEIEPEDTSSSQEESSEESIISSAFVRLMMLMKIIKDSFKVPGIMLVRLRFISFEEINNGTQPEGEDFSSSSDDGINAQNNINPLEMKPDEEEFKSNSESEKVNNKESVETNTEAPPLFGKEEETVEATEKMHEHSDTEPPPLFGKQEETVEATEKLHEHSDHKNEEIEHQENSESQSAKIPPPTEADTKPTEESSTPSPEENEIAPPQGETNNNAKEKSFFTKAVDAVSGFFGSIFG